MSAITYQPPPQTLVMHDGEQLLRTFDFSQEAECAAGATVASAVVTQVGGDGLLTVGAPALSGAFVQVELTGGTTGAAYLLKCVATLNDATPTKLTLYGYVQRVP